MTDYKALVDEMRAYQRAHEVQADATAVGGVRRPDHAAEAERFKTYADAIEALLEAHERDMDRLVEFTEARTDAEAERDALEARVVELEAVVQAAKEWNTLTNGRPRYRDFDELISKAPSVVLADHMNRSA